MWDTVSVDASHRGDSADYLEILTNLGPSITISPNHYLHSSAGATTQCCGSSTLTLASDVVVNQTVYIALGDEAMPGSEDTLAPAQVSAIRRVRRFGRHNFILEQSGASGFRSLVANGVVASSFTSDWRLIDSFGFQMADRMYDPVREMVKAGLLVDSTSVNGIDLGEDPQKSALMRTARAMEDLIADCLEAHMHGCSDAEMRAQVGVIEARAQEEMPADQMAAISTVVERLADRHISLLPRPIRRLAAKAVLSMSMGNSSFSSLGRSGVISLLTAEARGMAITLCLTDERCEQDMPPDMVNMPVWSVPLVVVGAALVGALLVPFGCLVYLVCSKKQMHFSTRTGPSTSLPKVVVQLHPKVAKVSPAGTSPGASPVPTTGETVSASGAQSMAQSPIGTGSATQSTV